MKIQKFKVSYCRLARNEIDTKSEVFFALSDKRYLNLLSNNAWDDVITSMTFDQYKYFLKKNKWYNSASLRILREKKKKELELFKKPKFLKIQTNPKLAIQTNPKLALKQALNLLNTGFTINKNVKKNAYMHDTCSICHGEGCGSCDGTGIGYTSVDYDLRNKEYKEKTKIIKKVINLIKNNLLPIKYGKNDDIVYFEYLGRQVSFHDPKGQIKNVKKFNGAWTGVPNKKIPFPCQNIKNSVN